MKNVEEMSLHDLRAELYERKNIAKKLYNIAQIVAAIEMLSTIAAVLFIVVLGLKPLGAVFGAIMVIGLIPLITLYAVNSINHNRAKSVYFQLQLKARE